MAKLPIEDEQLEYKKSTAELKSATDSIVAILNKHQSGVLYFGVKPNGDVVGQQVSDKTLREVSQAIRDRIEPRISPQVMRERVDALDCIKVVFSGSDVPYSSSNVYYIRIADEDVKMSRAQLEEFLHARYNREHPWDQRVSHKTFVDVDIPALISYIERGNASGRISFTYDDPRSVLGRLRLLDGDNLLNAGRLCFCDPPFALIKMAVFAGRDNGSAILDMKREDGNLFDALMAGWQYVLKNTRQRFEFNGGRRDEIPEIPTAAVREAVVNALCHRQWEETMDVSVTVFSDRVEIFSPGPFPEGVDPNDLLLGKKTYSKSRNQLLADTLYKSKDIEYFGTGLHRIQTLCNAARVGVEVITEAWGFTVVFYRPDWSMEFEEGGAFAGLDYERTGYGPSHADKVVAILSSNDSASTSELANKLGLSLSQTRYILREMVAEGLLKRIGTGAATKYQLKTGG
jgi:ATP-dependent DNA helicase RecG